MLDGQQKKGTTKPPNPVEEALKLLEYTGEDRVVSAQEIWDEAAKKGRKPALAATGFEEMDKALKGGFYEGQLIIVSGNTGEGKTTLLRTFTNTIVEQGVTPLWFSYEEIEEDFLEGFPREILPLFFMPKVLARKSIDWIQTRIKEAKLKHDARAVFVDHLHYLIDLYKMRNASIEIGAIARDLKLVAKENKIALFLIAHILKVEKTRELQGGDIRDSGLIETEADTVIYVWRDHNKENTGLAKITKNRKGGKVNVKIPMSFNEATGLFEPYTRQWIEQEVNNDKRKYDFNKRR